MLKYVIIAIVIVAAVILLRRMFARPPTEPFAREKPRMITMDGAVAAEIDGQELDIDPALLDEIRKLSDSGDKIEAIKLLREATGLGLAEAKGIVESLDRLHPKGS